MTNNDTKYPIYHTQFRWNQDGEYDEKYPKWFEGLPEGRMWNSTGYSKMYKEDPGVDSIKQEAQEWWNNYVNEKLEGKHPSDPEITITGPRLETWCLTWFQHYTFDDGRSDQEFMGSFERYVRRYEHMQDYMNDLPDDYVCLMGAQDRWRWVADTDNPHPPCRCEHCKKQGVVRIGH